MVGVAQVGNFLWTRTHSRMAAVIAHGGAGAYAIPDDLLGPKIAGCRRAVQEAHRVLAKGNSAVDAGNW